eukprot:Lithocolla_globosa_v1_NODE_1992_length_2222_cov_7.690355.p2 type:complete len:104 gc:universal NODE_1992_length_2222_cov_7.690355:1617-1928(+)
MISLGDPPSPEARKRLTTRMMSGLPKSGLLLTGLAKVVSKDRQALTALTFSTKETSCRTVINLGKTPYPTDKTAADRERLVMALSAKIPAVLTSRENGMSMST